MGRFSKLDAIACALPIIGIDTDQLIPARFMSRPRAAGYGGFLLHDLRFDPTGAERPDFPLNREPWRGAQVLVAGRSFGSGSSREAAVYALWDFGIRCVIAASFGDIFASNAVKNGLLPAQVNEADGATLCDLIEASPATAVTVDLERQMIACAGREFAFSIDPVRRMQLLNGWDDLDLTALHADAIKAFRHRRQAETPWLWPPTHS